MDTSSLVKLYVEETDSDKIRKLLQKATIVSTSKVAYVEARAAFARKHREEGFSYRDLRNIISDLDRDWESYFVIDLTDGLIRFAGDIAEKYLLRAFDSIHLASVINLKMRLKRDIYFSCNDLQLNRAAEKEGIIIM